MNPILEPNYLEIRMNQMILEHLERYKCLELQLQEIHKNLEQQMTHSMYFEVFHTNLGLTEHCQSLILMEFHMNLELTERRQLLVLMVFHMNQELTEH